MKKAFALVSMVSAGLVACASKPSTSDAKVVSPPPATSSAPVVGEQPPDTRSSGAFPDGTPRRLVGEDAAWYARAREAVTSGDLYLAKRLLLRLVAGYRAEPLFLSQLAWVQDRIEASAKKPREAMEVAKLVTVPASIPSFRLSRAAKVSPRPVPKLALRQSKANGITDENRWFEVAGPRAEIALPEIDTRIHVNIHFTDPESTQVLQRVSLTGWLPSEPAPHLRRAPFPTWIPPTFGSAGLSRVTLSGDQTLAWYGGDRYLFVFDEKQELVRAFDLFLVTFPESHVARSDIKVGELQVTTEGGTAKGDLTVKDFGPRHDVQWAEVRDGVLYVSSRFNGYAKEVKGLHAYVTGVELVTGDVLFRSPPLTSNGSNFVFVGGALVTGYGFTAEPDFVYCLDAATGKVVQKLGVPSSPEQFAWNESTRQLLVRTYDHDLVFAAN